MSEPIPLNCRVDRELKDAIVKAAKDDNRSVASLIRLVMKRWLREKGYLSANEPQASRGPRDPRP